MKKKKKGKQSGRLFSLPVLSILLGVLILICDQAIKYDIQQNVPRIAHEAQWYPYWGRPVFEDFFGIEFSIVHAVNRGAAWGMLSEYRDYLVAVRILFIGGLIGYLVKYNDSRAMILPFTLVIAGAVGNIIDIFAYGHVIDMFKFVFWGYHYPVFNIADSSIFIGVASLFLVSYLKQKASVFRKA